MDKCSHCYIVDRAKLAYCPDCKKVKKTSQDMSMVDVLDKIRAEIQENINYNKKMNYQGIVAGLLLTLDIIDKYKAESGDKK